MKLGPNQELWITDLESGGAEQGTGCLEIWDTKDDKTPQFCCLGRLCKVLDVPVKIWEKGFDKGRLNGTSLASQSSVFKASKLKSVSGEPSGDTRELVKFVAGIVGDPTGVRDADCVLTSLNDELKFTFPQIASVLRKFPDLYFEGTA